MFLVLKGLEMTSIESSKGVVIVLYVDFLVMGDGDAAIILEIKGERQVDNNHSLMDNTCPVIMI